MAKKPRRIPEENVFVTRELFKGVTTITTAKVLQRDDVVITEKSRGMLQPVSRDIKSVQTQLL